MLLSNRSHWTVEGNPSLPDQGVELAFLNEIRAGESAACLPKHELYHLLPSPEMEVNSGHSRERGFLHQREERLPAGRWNEEILQR